MSLLIKKGIRSRTAHKIHVGQLFLIPRLIFIQCSFIGLEHATIKDNIIFGCPGPFIETRYQSVLDACALRQDLAILDAGDMTGRYQSFCCCFRSALILLPLKKSEKRASPCQVVSALELH